MENENDKNQENDTQGSEVENEDGNMKSWFQENLRIIVSVLIVVAIAAGVYSYSKRSQNPAEENRLGMTSSTSEENISSEDNSSEIESPEVIQPEQETNQAQTQNKQEDSVSSAAASQETEGSFIETAGKGDGLTHLARRSLANYLEKNPDSSLTAEHKIYIEDYLRKNVGYKNGVRIGTSVEFSKQLIQDAIGKAKSLNESQLQNLHKYAVRVPSLS